MKQKDIVLLTVSIFISVLVSFLVAKYIFSTPGNLDQQVAVVPVISTDFPSPNTKYFNSQAIDPTELINIASGNNQQPFNGTSK